MIAQKSRESRRSGLIPIYVSLDYANILAVSFISTRMEVALCATSITQRTTRHHAMPAMHFGDVTVIRDHGASILSEEMTLIMGNAYTFRREPSKAASTVQMNSSNAESEKASKKGKGHGSQKAGVAKGGIEELPDDGESEDAVAPTMYAKRPSLKVRYTRLEIPSDSHKIWSLPRIR